MKKTWDDKKMRKAVTMFINGYTQKEASDE